MKMRVYGKQSVMLLDIGLIISLLVIVLQIEILIAFLSFCVVSNAVIRQKFDKRLSQNLRRIHYVY